MNPCPSFFTSWEDDRVAMLLQTGFCRFQTDHMIDGLARVKDANLEILAIVSMEEGKGNLRRFIAEAKTIFNKIEVLAIMNDNLEVILSRYGFKPFIRLELLEKITGMQWTKG